MISNTSLSAFSAADMRPADTRGVRPPPPPSERAPVDATTRVDRVRSQAESPAAQKLLAPDAGNGPAPSPGRNMPRGSLLDLSV
jgi:hypothetical protein